MITKAYEELFDKNGIYKIDSRYKEIFKLATMLFNVGIPFDFHNFADGWQLEYFSKHRKKRICSVIENNISYGSENDKLEIMGLLESEEGNDKFDVLGCLTAREVFERIQKHYKQNFYKGE